MRSNGLSLPLTVEVGAQGVIVEANHFQKVGGGTRFF